MTSSDANSTLVRASHMILISVYIENRIENMSSDSDSDDSIELTTTLKPYSFEPIPKAKASSELNLEVSDDLDVDLPNGDESSVATSAAIAPALGPAPAHVDQPLVRFCYFIIYMVVK